MDCLRLEQALCDNESTRRMLELVEQQKQEQEVTVINLNTILQENESEINRLGLFGNVQYE